MHPTAQSGDRPAAPPAAIGAALSSPPGSGAVWLAPIVGLVVLLLALGALVVWGGNLGHRSVAEMAGSLPIGQGIERVRLEIQNGTIGIDVQALRTVAYAGGVRRAADSAAQLKQLEGIPLAFTGAPDPADPRTFVVRGPAIPDGGGLGVFGLEIGLRLPADLPLTVVVTGSGHVTVANRRAATEVVTGRGDLRFEKCAGGVKARTGRGMVIAFEHRGDLDIHTMVGDMQAFVREPGASLRLITGQGTVQCHVPPTVEFDLDARAETGRIGNGFGLVPETVLEYGAVLVGKRGNMQTKIVLRTGAGHLSIAPKTFD